MERPFANFEELQVLENYVPTILATLIEPFWVLLNRFLCIIQPFQDMRGETQKPELPIHAKYTAVPPQLAIIKAIKSRHFTLAAVCLVAVLCNVLAVGLGGLFNESPVSVTYPSGFQYLSGTQLSARSLHSFHNFAISGLSFNYEDHFYVALANLGEGTVLPPWASDDFYFQPFESSSELSDNTSDVFYGITRGFGVDPACTGYQIANSSSSIDLVVYEESQSPKGLTCSPQTYKPKGISLDPSVFPARGKCAFEITGQAFPDGTSVCQKMYVNAWARTDDGTNPNSTIHTSWAVCYPKFRTAEFNVSVDSNGHILSSTPISAFSSELDYAGSTNDTDYLIDMHNTLYQSNDPVWHNSTYSQDWMNELIKFKTNSSVHLDPNAPAPDPRVIIPQLEEIYQLTFAILMSLNSDVFTTPRQQSLAPFTGSRVVTETRIFLPQGAVVISISILAIDVVAAIILYTFAFKHFLPRLPTSIGSILAYVAPSRALKAYQPDSIETLGLGRYTGDDGRTQFGIELSRYVVPVQLSSLRTGNTTPLLALWRKVRFPEGSNSSW